MNDDSNGPKKARDAANTEASVPAAAKPAHETAKPEHPKRVVKGRIKTIPILSTTGGQIAGATSKPWTHEDRQEIEAVVIRLAETIMSSNEIRDLATELAHYRTYDVRGTETALVSVERAGMARRLAIRLLSVGLFPDSRPDDITLVERVREVELSTARPLELVAQKPSPDGRQGSRFKRGVEIPTEPFETILLHTFQGVGFLPLTKPFVATKQILQDLVRRGGANVPSNFRTALAAMDKAGSVERIPKKDVERARVDAAIRLLKKIHDPKKRRARITFKTETGGTWRTAWRAAAEFARCFGVTTMPLKPSAALRDRPKGQR